MNQAEIARLLSAAETARRAGQSVAAADHLHALLRLSPDHPGALNMLGMQALASGDAASARAWFERAANADPQAAALWMNLATAHRRLADDAGEGQALDRVLGLDRLHFMALVRKAELHQRRGEDAQAAQHWTRAIAVGSRNERLPPDLMAVLEQAARFVTRHNRAFGHVIDQGLEAARAEISVADRRRFDACIDHLLGRRAIYANECEGIRYPFLPADEFFDRRHFPWLEQIEARTGEIRAELETLLREGAEGFRPYVELEPGTPQSKWTPLDGSFDWSAFHLWRHGERIEWACECCPVTSAAVEALPLAFMPRRTPTVFFSVLQPRTRLPAHTGVSNTRAIIHLPLIVPPGCGFRVGGETREWEVGNAFAFDDTIEHEAWNDSDSPRAVLIFDTWNPHLSETERRLLQQFFAVADASGHDPSAPLAVADRNESRS